MAENIDLTLTPEADAAAAQRAPAAPALTLNDTPAEKKVEPVQIDESMLTEAERKAVDDFAGKIDITDANQVLQYGAAAQKNIAGFSESALANVRTKDLGEVGDALSSLVVELKGFDTDEDKKGFLGFLKRKGNQIAALKAQYDKAEVNVDKITAVLEQHQIALL
ncbi:MAG TPA: toxic anion resistance protein, partial [Oscillospiraceae bacterium]|nr:toxic anion resistance protein [Oscillospiraceae bacterium]